MRNSPICCYAVRNYDYDKSTTLTCMGILTEKTYSGKNPPPYGLLVLCLQQELPAEKRTKISIMTIKLQSAF